MEFPRPTPEHERLPPGDIDLTGVVDQDDSLRTAIDEALAQTPDDGIVPDWGARSLARALANQQPDRHDSALHHFAVTGRIAWEPMMRELATLYAEAPEEERGEWATHLGSYITDHLERAEDTNNEPVDEIPLGGTALERVSAYLRIAIHEADARGEVIEVEDAKAIATLLAALLGPSSEMAIFAETGNGDADRLRAECRQLRQQPHDTAELPPWTSRLEQYLAAQPPAPRTS
ncbi:hypothetical protein [Thermomonospora umbrina]|uniref:Uncharacterized protein n=1 Tax=Thermomonospora umbrina TaxID=111806 RepID=A0A3D9SFQ9_9ACTN|nr:hypothetical protein [Thermomonospora umbrina]REE94729.1 hypothetical protein DFJ69_0079 [Thermomonospora umbrina]